MSSSKFNDSFTKIIESVVFLSKNQIKLIRSLQLKKFRDSNQLFIVEGIKMVEELFRQENAKIVAIYYTPDCELAIPNNVEGLEITEKELSQISGLKKPNKILALLEQNNECISENDDSKLILVLDEIKDPGNLGTILRTADWYGINKIIASKNTVELYNPKVIQSSMGAIFRINIQYLDLSVELTEIQKNGYQLIGASLSGSDLYGHSFNDKTAIIMGSESHGISEEIQNLLDGELSIPKYGESESLNVSIATGIFIAEYFRQG